MAVSEESRHHLYNKLESVLGRQDATALMEHLPPVGWADVATKRDLDALEERVSGRFETQTARFDNQIAVLRSDIEHELRLLTWRILVVTIAAMSLLVAVTRAFG